MSVPLPSSFLGGPKEIATHTSVGQGRSSSMPTGQKACLYTVHKRATLHPAVLGYTGAQEAEPLAIVLSHSLENGGKLLARPCC